MNKTISSEENHSQESSLSEERANSEESFKLDELQKLIINDNLTLFFDKDCSFISLTPIIPPNKIDCLFKLYNIPFSKDELITKIKDYINKQEAKINKIYNINNIRVHKTHGNIIIIDDQFNSDCIALSKQNNNALQIIAEKIALKLFNTKNIIYKYEKSLEQEKMIYALAYLKIDENIFVKSDLFESEKLARNDANKKILIKYLPKKLVKELMNNIEHVTNLEEKKKFIKKERYEKYLSEAGFDRKLLNQKRNLSIEEFSKRLPYFNMLKNDKNKNRNEKGKKNLINKRPNKNNKIILDEEDEEDFFINTEGTPYNEILLGDPNIVNNHLRDFKYTPLKLFEMIRDSEKRRGVDLNIEYSQLNDKDLRVKFQATIISQKLGIKVKGFGNVKEEAGNKCALNLLAVMFKKFFKTYYQLHEYFENKNGKYLDLILKPDNNDNEVYNSNKKEKKINSYQNNDNNNDKKIINIKIINENNDNNNKDGNNQKSKFENWINYSIKKKKVEEDSDYWLSKDSKDNNFSAKFNKSLISEKYNESKSQQTLIEDKKGSKKSCSENQESFIKFDLDQINSSEFMNNTSSSDINIISNLNNFNLGNNSGSREMDDLMKNSGFGFSESNYSIANRSKK